MLQAERVVCTGCGRPNPGAALACDLCGRVLRHERSSRSTALTAPDDTARPGPGIAPTAPAWEPPPPDPAAERRARVEPWVFLGLGALTAPVFALTPFLGFMGWFLASLAHEMGHAGMAWLFGMPSVPAISPAGHAAAVHSDQQLFLVGMILLALGTAAWKLLAGHARFVALGVLAVVYPALAFTGARELLHLLAGHGGELAFATFCLWKTLDGGFTASRLERLLYGTLGWFLLGANARLCFGLMTSADSRAWYAENGSFGFTNDYLRVAEDLLGWRLQSVALLMLVATLLVLPAALLVWRSSRMSRGD